MDRLELMRTGDYSGAIELARTIGSPEALLAGAQAAIHLFDFNMAHEFLTRKQPFADHYQEAERLAHLGVVHYYLGDLEKYSLFAAQAANLAPTFFTLYHLSRTIPPREAILVLHEALALATNPYDQAKASIGLARSLGRLGRYREAFPHSAWAVLRDSNPYYVLDSIKQAIYGDDEVSLEELAQQVESYLEDDSRGIRADASCLLAEIMLMQGKPQRARALFEQTLLLVGGAQLPFMAQLGVRIYRALGLEANAKRLVQATQVASDLSRLHQGLVALARGMELFPNERATEQFEKTLALLHEDSPLECLKARIYLCALRKEPLPLEYREIFTQWSGRARRTLPPLVDSIGGRKYRLEVLGRAALFHGEMKVDIRPRGLELLVVLLMKPQGWERGELAQALYGEKNVESLKMELRRLRTALEGGLASAPWRLDIKVEADFLEFREQLRAGQIGIALEMYSEALLPKSKSPAIEELRESLREELREVVLFRGDLRELAILAEKLVDDLEVWEALITTMPRSDQRYPAVLAHLNRIKGGLHAGHRGYRSTQHDQ